MTDSTANGTGRLAGLTALITGASSGIGRGIALRYAAEGAKVAVNYLGGSPDREAQAREVVEACGGAGRAIAVAGDVSKRTDVEAMVAETVRAFGRLDVAVNNAGIQVRTEFLDITDDEWDKVLGVNLRGAFLVTQAACRQFLAQEPLPGREARGKIVNVSSTHEDIPFPHHTTYCVSKGGVRMLTRNLAVDLAPQKININSIAPGAIATPINQSALEDAAVKDQVVTETPWGRWGKPDDIAPAAVFLASPESDYVSGITLYVDGALALQVTQH